MPFLKAARQQSTHFQSRSPRPESGRLWVYDLAENTDKSTNRFRAERGAVWPQRARGRSRSGGGIMGLKT